MPTLEFYPQMTLGLLLLCREFYSINYSKTFSLITRLK